MRKRLSGLLQFEVTALCNFESLLQSFRNLSKDFLHFLLGLDKKLISGETHAIVITHRFPSLDAEQDFMSPRILPGYIMAIIGGHERDGQFFGKFDQLRVD